MNILFITGHGIGGSNVSLANLIVELKKKEISMTVVVPDESTYCFFIEKGVCCVCIPFCPSLWPVCLSWYHYLTAPFRFCVHRLMNLIGLFKLYKLSKKINPNIIHTNVSVINIGYALARMNRIPHVFHIREYCDLDFNYKRYPSESSFHNKLKKSYNISITKDLFSYYNLNELNSKVVYNGILQRQDYYATAKDSFFLYVGGLSHEKGIDSLIDAFISIARKDAEIKLLICGNGNNFFVNKLLSKINKENERIANRIVFLGQRKDVYQLMSNAKALVVPSLSEAFGRITAEAMFNDCLVIGNNVAGTKEQFDNGLFLTGEEIGIRYSTVQELIAAIETVNKKNEESYRHIREKAFDVVNTLYTTEHNAEEVFKFYEEILHINFDNYC